MKIDRKLVDEVFASVKHNHALLAACSGPHDFVRVEPSKLFSKYRCSICGGTADTLAVQWYQNGLVHGRRANCDDCAANANMQLAAISTATIQNTEATVKDRIGSDNPYWTVAYGDVCRAVDREMFLREENQKLRHDLDRAAPNPQRDFVKESNVLLAAKDAELSRLRAQLESVCASRQEEAEQYREVLIRLTARAEKAEGEIARLRHELRQAIG